MGYFLAALVIGILAMFLWDVWLRRRRDYRERLQSLDNAPLSGGVVDVPFIRLSGKNDSAHGEGDGGSDGGGD